MNNIHWSVDWRMLFNVDKCSVMHVGKSNHGNEHALGEEGSSHHRERNLGVIFRRSMNPSQQCMEAAKKGN